LVWSNTAHNLLEEAWRIQLSSYGQEWVLGSM
jgi:hypothetical protein